MELVFVVTALLLFSEGLRGAYFENAIVSIVALVMFAVVLSHRRRVPAQVRLETSQTARSDE